MILSSPSCECFVVMHVMQQVTHSAHCNLVSLLHYHFPLKSFGLSIGVFVANANRYKQQLHPVSHVLQAMCVQLLQTLSTTCTVNLSLVCFLGCRVRSRCA